ncbi:ABC transporter permease [Telmatospirillum siberiense]|uniref:ABC transporter permease n=1 Tax=Telmatospirillum siberiense TaxID=382514 RepID=A0A2N3PQE4_9PROT|nr:ABC transporter permease [Telmatospirillum siberiense]PKU22620.1 ABC transporter permease [Telmatospirillum siberiense]
MEFLFSQFLTGLASASSLFLVASGLSIIFGVSRIVNFAHGSLYMLGAYIAYSLVEHSGLGGGNFWIALPVAALGVALLGLLLEVTLLRKIYHAPELLQLLATFGVVLVVQDAVLMIWGPEDLLGPRAPGLAGAVRLFHQAIPQYDLFLISLGPVVLALLWLLFHRTHWGTLVRAATHDRDMVAALGVNQASLFTGVFTLGALLAGLGGALQLPRGAVSHAMDLQIIVEVFVVVVIGGLGNVFGAFLAAIIIGELNAFGILVFPQMTLVLTFLAMAVILVVRPWGLRGKPQSLAHGAAVAGGRVLRRLPPAAGKAFLLVAVLLLALPWLGSGYALNVATEMAIYALFAASLHLLSGIGGMVSFGHAAYFGLGSYGAALAAKSLGLPMELALLAGPLTGALGALVYGWFCVRLSGVYLSMLTLAFAQITYAVAFQWSSLTGGDNGILGVWPSHWASGPVAFYYLTLVVCGGSILILRHIVFSPFGYTLRACRDSEIRADAIGIDARHHRWLAFILCGFFAGLAGGLFAFFKGSVFPDSASIGTSVDGLVMVLLGGIQTLTGPVVGAVIYTALRIFVSTYTDYWRAVIGVVIILLVVAFPQGIVAWTADRFQAWRAIRPAVKTKEKAA